MLYTYSMLEKTDLFCSFTIEQIAQETVNLREIQLQIWTMKRWKVLLFHSQPEI